jgi:hypothetical protein
MITSSTQTHNVLLTRPIYELYCCILHSALCSYRKESILTPFPSHFISINSSVEIKDFDRISKILGQYMPSISVLFLKNGKRSFRFLFSTELELKMQVERIFEEQDVFNIMLERHKHPVDSKLHPINDEIRRDVVALFAFIVKHYAMRPFTLKYLTKNTYLKRFYDQKDKTLLEHYNVIPDHVFQFVYKKENELFNSCETQKKLTCFHGTSSENIYSILGSSLLNLSNTKLMQHGSVFGEGIYLCDDIRVARSFSKAHHGTHWSQTQILGMNLTGVFECDVLKDHKDVNISERYVIVRNRDCVRIKHLLVYSDPVSQNETSNIVALFNPSISSASEWSSNLIEWKSIFIVLLGILIGIILASQKHLFIEADTQNF